MPGRRKRVVQDAGQLPLLCPSNPACLIDVPIQRLRPLIQYIASIRVEQRAFWNLEFEYRGPCKPCAGAGRGEQLQPSQKVKLVMIDRRGDFPLQDGLGKGCHVAGRNISRSRMLCPAAVGDY
jgi:hypothetical protein